MTQEERVLILSEDLDYHGVAVRWGLRELGVPLDWWDRTQFPRADHVSTWVSGEGARMAASSCGVTLVTDRYRSVWNRRGQVPQASGTLERTDQIVARNESTFYLAGLASMLADANPKALFVNGFENAKTANSKIHQLHVAQSVGFKVPKTLVSNDPVHIRAFFEQNNGRIVTKQHIPFAWRTRQGALLVTGTSAVSAEHLASDLALSACPMIYQETLEVESELRITVLGGSAFALNQVRTRAPLSDGFVDIRYEDADKRAIAVSTELVELCRAYMNKLGLTYAAFDIAKLPSGEYVFIEANEAGQFLFLEDQAPELALLDAFCQFLASGNPNFCYRAPAGLTLADFEKTDDARQFHERYDAHMAGSKLTSPFELVE